MDGPLLGQLDLDIAEAAVLIRPGQLTTNSRMFSTQNGYPQTRGARQQRPGRGTFLYKKAAKGGASETPTEKLDATMTCGLPSSTAAMAATPDGKCPKASRTALAPNPLMLSFMTMTLLRR